MKLSFSLFVVFSLILRAISKCFEPGLCLGRLIEAKSSESRNACLETCYKDNSCKWVSFDPETKVCYKSKSCSKVVLTDQSYQHSKGDCKLMDKILVIGGIGENDEPPEPFAEVVLLDQELKTSCEDITNENLAAYNGIMGGMFEGVPTFCGGWDPNNGYSSKCYQLVGNEFKRDKQISVAEDGFGFAGTGQFHEELLFIGGQNKDHILNKIFHLVRGELHIVSMLPQSLAIRDNCIVSLSKNKFMIIGGWSNTKQFEDRTLILELDFNTDGLTVLKNAYFGPSLRVGRNRLACGVQGPLDGSNEVTIVVAGGHINSMAAETNSVECLYTAIEDGQEVTGAWTECPPLPLPIAEAVMVTDQETGHLYLLGGKSQANSLSLIHKLESTDGQWKEHSIKMKSSRKLHSSFFVPNDKLPCT